ncbi:DUF2852 domain-containing protein [Pseudochelatococcus contaminans]|uniref:DUF2852 domain-containing protein n=1 Tax=Pseudochelatococcus contaminans TaxID=1538103 RepID=A0A7W6EFU5_9HYPH|nr:DUF2852 domain-containing protein [Pseudochelatococcus contaminans]MBB3808985.1 hypothetical protein [Pseudochelatococcus contaminans]
MTNRDTRSSFNNWRPTELAALVIGLIVFWPLGIAVLAWKYWNDRSASPRNLDEIFGEGVRNLRGNLSGIFGSVSPKAGPGDASTYADDLAPTGNAAFDAHVRDELHRIDTRRQHLAEEVRAFRAFLDEERTGGPEVYERFRRRQETGRDHTI